nr:uncharacterized protein LOC117867049 isoform X1 [Setaria viridis]
MVATAAIIFFLSAMAISVRAAVVEHTFVVSQVNMTHLSKETLVTVVNGQLPGPAIEGNQTRPETRPLPPLPRALNRFIQCSKSKVPLLGCHVVKQRDQARLLPPLPRALNRFIQCSKSKVQIA